MGFFGGVVLGLVFFGGLYWSVQQLPTVKHPGLLMMASLLVRMAVLLTGLYFLMAGEIKNLLAAVVGVMLMKFVMIARVREKPAAPTERE
ncbi:MAG: ATP synthase subunit I [Bacillota bacterium]|nr:ATP synthase subunit I [Bacillota bacterium]MDW7677665.1 ATP synthase subunit I [Bacillota bacterium]